jgi:hypothetical protein
LWDWLCGVMIHTLSLNLKDNGSEYQLNQSKDYKIRHLGLAGNIKKW